MSLPIYVDGHSGWRAKEPPRSFVLDEELYQIIAIEAQWRSPDVMFFKVRTVGRQFILRHDEEHDEWTLESGLDGTELFARPTIQLINVDASGIRKAEAQIAACERCRPEESGVPFDCVLADVLGKRGMYDFVLIEAARCPNCRSALSEKTLVERHGGIETCVSA